MHVPDDWAGKDLKCLACNRHFLAYPKGDASAHADHEETSAIWHKLSKRFAELFSSHS
jgi:hypothetical protein